MSGVPTPEQRGRRSQQTYLASSRQTPHLRGPPRANRLCRESNTCRCPNHSQPVPCPRADGTSPIPGTVVRHCAYIHPMCSDAPRHTGSSDPCCVVGGSVGRDSGRGTAGEASPHLLCIRPSASGVAVDGRRDQARFPRFTHRASLQRLPRCLPLTRRQRSALMGRIMAARPRRHSPQSIYTIVSSHSFHEP